MGAEVQGAFGNRTNDSHICGSGGEVKEKSKKLRINFMDKLIRLWYGETRSTM
jgi:hypothetical protein